MAASKEGAPRDAIDCAAIDDHNEECESCLRRRSALLFDGDQALDEPVKASLRVFMRERCGLLLDRIASLRSGERNCAFRGRSPPDVRFGAGPSGSACEGCVDDFANHFCESPPS